MQQSIGKKYSQFVNVLIFIFPIVINSLQVAGDIVLFILAMMGIFIAISQKLSPFTIKEIKVFSYLGISYFIAVCLSVLLSGQVMELAHYIPRDLYFLFAPFIALALYKAEININYLVVGAKVALLVLGAIIIFHLLSGVPLADRPTGVINSAVFGNLSVSLFYIVLVFPHKESFKHKIFWLLSLSSGLFIIIASGTRGAWISFILLLGVYCYFYYKQKTKLSTKSKIIILLLFTIALSFIGLNESLKDRLNLSFEKYTYYGQDLSEGSSGPYIDKTPTSIGLRLTMYSEAINNIKDVPFFGHGYRYSNIALFKNNPNEMAIISSRFNHLHNAFLTNYYNGGIILLSALILILFIPLRLFIKGNSQNRENPLFISGAILTLGYASFGMINILLGDTYMNGFYVFFLAIFLLLSNKSLKTSKV